MNAEWQFPQNTAIKEKNHENGIYLFLYRHNTRGTSEYHQ